MGINTDNVKAGDWVQIANGDWFEVKAKRDYGLALELHYDNGEKFWIHADSKLLTDHRTAEEVETNGLPVSGNPDDLVSKAEVDRIVEDALYRLKAQVAKAVFDNDYMWDDLAELGINPELEKESNECNER